MAKVKTGTSTTKETTCKGMHVFITDPEEYRVIEFTDTGEFVRAWRDFGAWVDEIGLAAGVTVDPAGFVWVTDAGNN